MIFLWSEDEVVQFWEKSVRGLRVDTCEGSNFNPMRKHSDRLKIEIQARGSGLPPNIWYAATPAVHGWLYYQALVHMQILDQLWLFSCHNWVSVLGRSCPPLQTAGF